jgi:hypothetical protein
VTEIWNQCRYFNQYLAILAAVGVGYRLAMMVLDPERRRDARSLHLIAWFGYIGISLFTSAVGASYYNASVTPANWTSGARTGLHLVAIALTIWWPHPRNLLHIGRTP